MTDLCSALSPGVVRNTPRYCVRRSFECDGAAYARGLVGGRPLLVFEHVSALVLTPDEERCVEICERLARVLAERGRGESLEVIVQAGEITFAGDHESFSLDLLVAAQGTLEPDGAQPNFPAQAWA